MTYMFTPSPNLHAPQFGAGAPVMLLHGSASHSAQWRSMIGCLSGRFKVITPDLPGYGKSAHPSYAAMSLEDMAGSILPLVEREGGPVHLVGHSFGGAVALKFASLYPGKVASLTLIEPAAFNVIRSQISGSNVMKAVGSSKAALSAGDASTAMGHFVDFWNGAGTWSRTSQKSCAMMCPQINLVHRDFDALMSDTFGADEAATVTAPTLVITGDMSPVEMGGIVFELKSLLPLLRSEEIKGAGHLVPLTDPHIVDPMVGDFIAQTELGWQSHAIAA